MLSIPRDTRTEIIGNGTVDKINHAYAFGGVPMSMNTVEKFLNIPIDYYTRIFSLLSVKISENLTFNQIMDIQKNYKDAGKNIQQMEIQETGAMINKIYYGLVSPAEKQRIQSILRTQLELNKKAN